MGGFDIRGQDAKQKQAKAKPRQRTRLGNQNANGSEDFADPREIDHGHRVGKCGGHHPRKVVAHFVEMSQAGKKKHHRQGKASGIHPRGEGEDSQSTETSERKKGKNQDEKDNHRGRIQTPQRKGAVQLELRGGS